MVLLSLSSSSRVLLHSCLLSQWMITSSVVKTSAMWSQNVRPFLFTSKHPREPSVLAFRAGLHDTCYAYSAAVKRYPRSQQLPTRHVVCWILSLGAVLARRSELRAIVSSCLVQRL
ncbi:hypothetical protein ARMSODRAFT_138652 [Armillaria solidipes]|uniref:Uncharacterized protein n=1 Tax=Armillaria solidipes TaxID=1076256 RepID=A0A2H3C2W9_9AGAR|nr:hypothetical protein ARMSODRAFT_138652 [Armillaria solidipes]